jgi:formylglycine-generating enzyme required for sulfatase activity
MKKLGKVLSLMLCLGVPCLQAQDKPTLTVLSFTGETGGDEETITVLLANDEFIRASFTMTASSGNFQQIIGEIQSNALNATNPNVLRNRFNADFAMIIHIEKVRSSNLARISLVNTENLQLLAGDFRKYYTIRDLRGMLPDIIKKLVNAATKNRGLAKLTVLPFYTTLNGEETERLAQLLSITIANQGKYAVFPWALPMEAPALKFDIPYSSIIDLDMVKIISQATNARYLLAGDLISLGTTNLFKAAIIYARDGSFLSEGDMEYRSIVEDLGLVIDLSSSLTNAKSEEEINPPAVREGIKVPVQTKSAVSVSAADTLKNFVRIEAGAFMMGSPLAEVSRDRDEAPHQVVVGSFYIGKYEVTQEEYEAVMGSNPSHFRGATLPVEQISWFDAVVYCNARSIREGLTPAYTIREEEIKWNHNADGYRLPTEAEWEYACRAGTTTAYNVGNNITPRQVNYDGNYPYNKSAKGIYRERTTSVGSFSPNAWGLYDMHGNVYEWCWDQYKPYNDAGLDGSMLADAVIRGGSWYSEARFLRSANRVHASHDARTNYIGFRLVRSIGAGPENR